MRLDAGEFDTAGFMDAYRYGRFLKLVGQIPRAVSGVFVHGTGHRAWEGMLRQVRMLFRPDRNRHLGAPETPMAQLLTLLAKLQDELHLTFTVVGHSMGTMVINEMLRRQDSVSADVGLKIAGKDLPARGAESFPTFDHIVYMAAACTVRDYESSVFPYLRENPGTNMHHLTLHPKAENEEIEAYDFGPRGSLLKWIDEYYTNPATIQDRTAGSFVNLMLSIDGTPPDLDEQVFVRMFPAGRAAIEAARADLPPVTYDGHDYVDFPQSHADFTHAAFWRKSFWWPPLANEAPVRPARFNRACLMSKPLIAIVLLLSPSCGLLSSLGGLAPGEEVTMQGPDGLVDKDEIEKIDLPNLLDPDLRGNYKGVKPGTAAYVERARDAFYLYGDAAELAQRRNRVQDRIVMASEHRYGRFAQYIQSVSSDTNFALGSLTTLLAGAGAIFTPASTVRALSGSAAIISGTRAEFNDSYYARKTIDVILDGIKLERKRIYEEIIEKRSNADIASYTVEGAIADALRFHNAAHISVGIKAAADAIEAADQGVGLKELTRALKENELLARGLGFTLPGDAEPTAEQRAGWKAEIEGSGSSMRE